MDFMNKKKLGYGCMRLPLLDREDQTSFDYETIFQLFDTFLERGFTYFDTAYVYHNYHGEEVIKRALTERHPRENFEVATKLPLRDFKDEADMERIFAKQLENCGLEYFDTYLLHNMGTNVYEKCCRYDVFRFVQQKKAEGKIGSVGMSFHDTPELLEEIMERYGDGIDFLQLQINYADWKQPDVQSGRCLEIAQKFKKPVCVMEPCKGGTLVNLPGEALELLRSCNPDASPASWAMRFAAGQKGVFCVLSGMNTMEQVLDNTDALADLQPLTESENELLRQVTDIINRKTAVPCTACEYCTHGCPKQIAIPRYFSLYNSVMQTTGSFSSQQVYYINTSLTHGKAGDCIRCGQCEKACPQHLPIMKHLEAVAEKFENSSILPSQNETE